MTRSRSEIQSVVSRCSVNARCVMSNDASASTRKMDAASASSWWPLQAGQGIDDDRVVDLHDVEQAYPRTLQASPPKLVGRGQRALVPVEEEPGERRSIILAQSVLTQPRIGVHHARWSMLVGASAWARSFKAPPRGRAR